ncbi:hypothetical protein MATL_G00213050 [Megalops atlanticus]|uniref:Interferon a3-like n=1 Tax=Megalops atlanticus TaxID=7932 RepID=A0A9D3PIV0_MEGAT|nr:hypothetical protein MATL_G00213050 [Megalops atlanticus]
MNGKEQCAEPLGLPVDSARIQARERRVAVAARSDGWRFYRGSCACPVPNPLYRRVSKAQVEDKITFLSETFDQIIKLFNGNLDAMAWNKQKLDHFLAVLDRQSRELKTCVPSSRKYEKRLTRYFSKLKKDVLKQRNFDSPSWELVRKEVRRHLQRLDLISASVKKEMK